ncbi:hypothetical protein OH77DRAFT_1509384 [Trametes cingulata]|nr:hypothetical protein OH77DRAFT_1509384 [Trametes cingulata]
MGGSEKDKQAGPRAARDPPPHPLLSHHPPSEHRTKRKQQQDGRTSARQPHSEQPPPPTSENPAVNREAEAEEREEKAAKRAEKYGGTTEEQRAPETSRTGERSLMDEDDDGMDYSDTYETPTPAQPRPREGEPLDEKEDGEREEKHEEDNEERLAPDEGHARGRKRLRTQSPTEDDEEQSCEHAERSGGPRGRASERGPQESWTVGTDANVRTQERAGEEKNASLQTTLAEAPPRHPMLPSAEDCEKLIEKVVQDASTTLRTKLRELVGKVQGLEQLARADENEPPMSQETRDYWQYCLDPSELLQQDELGRILGEQSAWSGKQEAAPPTSSFAFPDIQYEDMETLYGRSVPRKVATSSTAQERVLGAWGRSASTAQDPIPGALKGKERQWDAPLAPMDIDHTYARQDALTAGEESRDAGRARSGGAGSPEAPKEMDKEMAEEQRREALRRKWEEARLADPIADKEASGQPEHRRTTNEQDLKMALKLKEKRMGEIEKLGLAPLLEHGNPAVHANDPRDRVRNVPASKLKEWRTKQPGTYVLLDVYGEGDIEDTDPQRIYDNLQAALYRITGLQNVALEQPPKTPRTVSKEHAATIWFASGLYPAAVALLTIVHAWPTADITFFAYKEVEFIPRYLFAIKGFTQSDQNEVRLAVWGIFHKSPVYSSILNLVKKNPDYVGMDHNKVANDILSTVEVAVRPVNDEPHARLITHVYMTSPTRSAAMWESWRDGFRYPIKGKAISEDHAHLEVSQRITRCKACHGADHLTTQCPYGHLEGWAKVVEGTGARRTDPWKAKNPRAGQSQYASEPGSTQPEDGAGSSAWTYVEGRGGGRGRGTRGGGTMRGAQPRTRRA